MMNKSSGMQGPPSFRPYGSISFDENEFNPWGWLSFANFNRLHQATACFSFSNFRSSFVEAFFIWRKSSTTTTKPFQPQIGLNVYWLVLQLEANKAAAITCLKKYKRARKNDLYSDSLYKSLCMWIKMMIDDEFDQIFLWKINDQIKLFSFSYIFSKGSFNKRIMK